MTEALNLSLVSEPEPGRETAADDLTSWPKPDLRLVPPLPETAGPISDADYVNALVKAGFAVVYYGSADRSADGRPVRIYPTYPL